MARYFLEVAYIGSNYSGFQIQKNANSIQAEIEKAMEIFFHQRFLLTGSSRTDAGVHAKQNFFHFDSEISIQNEQLYNLNSILPNDIVLKNIFPVPNQAHSRFDAVSREYNYIVYQTKDPFLHNYGWHYPYPLDMDLLQEAASLIVGQQDFSSFSKKNTQVKNFVCIVHKSQWVSKNNKLVYIVNANRFLRGMVKGLVSTMLLVGRKKISIENFKEIIHSQDCRKANFSAPSQGLFLMEVNYDFKQHEV